MKKFNNITILLSAAVTLGTVTSCDLDLLPLNEVVLENFWTNKSDVQSVVNSCYVSMQENNYVQKMIIWGECRSDNVEANSQDVENCPGLRDLLRGQLKTTNEVCDWSSMYKVINNCNNVIKYAPQVQAKDPNYTESDMYAHFAEVKTLRAISYFTLVKTFRDVPFTFEPTIDDTKPFAIKATKGEVVIDSLIEDLETWKNFAPRKYIDSYSYNSAFITIPAIYATLADLYLWKASNKELPEADQKAAYMNAIRCCDYVIEFKRDEYKKDEGVKNWEKQDFDKQIWATFGYPLLAEETTPGTNVNGSLAATAIFGDGNSFESLFELTYGQRQEDIKNDDVSNMYYSVDMQQNEHMYVYACENLMETAPTPATTFKIPSQTLFFATDYRSINSFVYSESGNSVILKYISPSNAAGRGNSYGTVGVSKWEPMKTVSVRGNGSNYEGWILYRLTDVMLMKAEAEICLAKIIKPDGIAKYDASKYRTDLVKVNELLSLKDTTLLYDDAFNLTTAVYMRSNPSAWSTDFQPKRDGLSTFDNFLTYVEEERQRELLFEGKRYFDLVRRARREGSTSHLATKVSAKYKEASKAFSIKLALMDFMYLPYYKKEIKANPLLVQNPAYYDEEENVRQ